jgi:hypothetical protein
MSTETIPSIPLSSAAPKRKVKALSLEPTQTQTQTAAAALVTPKNATNDNTHHQVSPDAEDNSNNSTKKKESPYSIRSKEMSTYRDNEGDDYIEWHMGDVLSNLSQDRLEELGLDQHDEDEDERTTEEKRERELALDKLTQEEVDEHFHAMIVPRNVMILKNKLYLQIMRADSRNDPEDTFVMLNTHSTYCMYPVIQKQITAATKEINKAVKAATAANNNAASPGIAKEAFQLTVATVGAIHDMDHWRHDTEDEEETEKIAKKMVKIIKDLLWFESTELGLNDPFSRKTLLYHLDRIANDWLGGATKLKVAKNGFGMGRDKAPNAAPAAAKKAKVTHVPAPVASAAAAGGIINVGMGGYLSAIDDKVALRIKTAVQLEIADMNDPSRSSTVIVSGATCMKKISQLCAYVTDKSSEYQYGANKGSKLAGSRIEISLGDKKTWLAEKSALKTAIAAGATLSVDKNVKIVQVFQGLTMGDDLGIAWDSEESKTLGAAAAAAVVWVASDESRYSIQVQAIVPAKCVRSKVPLPRIVVQNGNNENPRAKNSFGKFIHSSNRHIRAERSGPRFIVMRGTSQARIALMDAISTARPICDPDGTVPPCIFGLSTRFTPECIASAGPPASTSK